MNEKQNLKNAFKNSLFYFLITTIIAILFKWNIIDVAWSIWITSFFIAISSVFAESIFMYWLIELAPVTEEQKASPHYKETSTISNIFSSLFMFGVLFYLVYSVSMVLALALNELLEIVPTVGQFSLFPILIFTIKKYWLFLLVAFIPTIQFYYQIYKHKKYTQDDTQEELLLRPYTYVFKDQALMLIIMGLTYFSNQLLTFWALLLFYFFPWSETWAWYKFTKAKSKKI